MKSHWFVNSLVVLALAFSTMGMTGSTAGGFHASSPFVGDWRAIDWGDGSDMRVSIGGPPAGPFRITWTESSFGGCEGEAGLVQGTGWLNPEDPNVLEADLHFECFTMEREADFHVTWVYHPDLNTLISQDQEGFVTIWTRPSEPMIPPRYPRLVASIEGDWFWTTDFLPNALLSISIFESQGGSQLWEGTKSVDESGFVVIESGDHAQNLGPGNYLVISDGFTEKGLLLETITIDVFDLEEGRLEGSAPALRYVYVVAADSPEAADQTVIETTADEDGRWIADFTDPFTDDWRPWSFAQIFDEDGDANEAGSPPPPPPPPSMGLRVNYGDDWVESFYEAGHWVELRVTNAEGALKATARLFTEPKDFWGGATGFQTAESDWEGGLPDLQPLDWVYAEVDNGVTAQVQLGDIQGTVDVVSDSITGTIQASWISDRVPVECLPWGSGSDLPNKDGGSVLTNGADPYSCYWDPSTEWDVQAWQDIGVGYITPDGHWVARPIHAEE